MELIIDTASNTAGLALASDGNVMAEITWDAGHNHTVQLLPNVIDLLDRAEAKLSDLKHLIVIKGPGTFNGLRVGLATTLGLAFTLDIPIVGINTLEAIAWPNAGSEFPVCPILSAGRGEIATAIYQTVNENWKQIKTEYITNIADLCSGITVKTVICGEINSEQQEQLKNLAGDKTIIPEKVTSLRKAADLLTLALNRISSGDFDDLSTLQALYLRKPSINTRK